MKKFAFPDILAQSLWNAHAIVPDAAAPHHITIVIPSPNPQAVIFSTFFLTIARRASSSTAESVLGGRCEQRILALFLLEYSFWNIGKIDLPYDPPPHRRAMGSLLRREANPTASRRCTGTSQWGR
jgi:hypothetical protein